MTPTTTFAKIRAAGPCKSRYQMALKKAGGLRAYGANTPITVRQIVEEMGLDDALWCLHTMPEFDHLWRKFAVNCVRRVQHLMTDKRSIAVLDVAEQHARGEATHEELAVARHAAILAAIDTVSGPAETSAEYAAAETARDSAAYAALFAASDSVSAVVSDEISTAERAWQAAELIRICEEM